MSAERTSTSTQPDFASLTLAVTEHAPLPMATVDGASHIIRYANPAFCRLMAQPMEALVGRPLPDLLPEKDPCLRLLDQVFRSGQPETYTERDGSKEHPVFWSYTLWPVRDEPHVGIMIQVTESAEDHDLTVAMNEALMLRSLRLDELNEAAESLNSQLREEIMARGRIAMELAEKAREAAEKARLLDLTDDAIIVRDKDGRITYWNRGAEDLYGWSSEEALGMVSHHLLQTEFLTPVEQMTEELHRNGRWMGELVHTRRDGRRITVLVRKTLDRESAEQPAMVVENITNITERKRAEQALRASEEQFASIFRQTTGGIAQTDLSGRFVLVNDRFCQIAGRSREVLLGLRMLDITHPDDLPSNLEKFDALIAGDISSFVIEVRYLRPEGEVVWVKADVARICDGDGRVHSIAAAVTDITERHVLQESLMERAEQLARADRSKDEFLAMLAHELRNPLAPLRNAAEILQDPEGAVGERNQAQRIIVRQVENMSRMIDDLLDVSRITEGKIELRKQPVALEAILTAATSLAHSGFAARQQDLAVSLPAEPVWLEADGTRLEQVFGNLLTNACKYSGNGSCITITAERTAGADPPEVMISVKDDGAGIAPELLPHVFDLFVQASRTLDRVHGGLGIGLTLVQRLVKLHGGSVKALSEGFGKGAEFMVRLPILRGPPPAPAPQPAVAQEIPRRILIVDDNADSARTLAILQTRRGHETRVAFNGPDAVSAAAEFLPDTVLLDIGLPGMDGLEVARRLRAMPALTGVRIFAMSGYGRDEDRAAATAAGFNQYMVKPVDLAQLGEWLRMEQQD